MYQMTHWMDRRRIKNCFIFWVSYHSLVTLYVVVVNGGGYVVVNGGGVGCVVVEGGQ